MIQQVQAVTLELRNDSAGEGHFGASRGTRTHNGIDYLCQADEMHDAPLDNVLSPVAGVVTKHGYCYADDLSYRYVEITEGETNYRHQIFYCEPLVRIGRTVIEGSVIGRAQDVTRRYPGRGMLKHIHHQIKNEAGEYLDPNTV